MLPLPWWDCVGEGETVFRWPSCLATSLTSRYSWGGGTLAKQPDDPFRRARSSCFVPRKTLSGPLVALWPVCCWPPSCRAGEPASPVAGTWLGSLPDWFDSGRGGLPWLAAPYTSLRSRSHSAGGQRTVRYRPLSMVSTYRQSELISLSETSTVANCSNLVMPGHLRNATQTTEPHSAELLGMRTFSFALRLE